MTLLLSAGVIMAKILLDSVVMAAFLIPHGLEHGPESIITYAQTLQSDGFVLAVATLTSAVPCTGLVVLIAFLRKGIGVRDYLALRLPTIRSFATWAAITVVVLLLTDAIRLSLGEPLVPDDAQVWYKTSRIPALLWIAFVVAAPIVEEIIFRGFMFRGLAATRAGNAGAVIIPALIWAAMHLQYNAIDMASIFILGIVWGVARIRTGSTYATMAFHAVTNIVATLETAAVVAQSGSS